MQKKLEGSDRQARGLVLRKLRASDVPVSISEFELVTTHAAQRTRAIAGVLADGLMVQVDGGYALPKWVSDNGRRAYSYVARSADRYRYRRLQHRHL